MRILDESSGLEIAAPDLTVGELRNAIWAAPEAYGGGRVLEESDYEEVQLFHRWTAEELEERAAAESDRVAALEMAVAEMGVQVYGGVAHG